MDFALHRGAIVQGTVRTQAGATATGAEVWLMPGNMHETAMGALSNIDAIASLGQLRGEADDQGRFEIIGVDFDMSYRLTAKREDSAQTVTDAFAVTQGTSPFTIDIALLPGSTVSGMARNDDGTPAANYGLMLFPNIGDMLTGPMGEPATTVTTETGAFEFKALGAGKFTLSKTFDAQNPNPFENDALNPFGTYVLEVLSLDMEAIGQNPLAALEMDRTPQIRQTIVIEEGVPLALDLLELPE